MSRWAAAEPVLARFASPAEVAAVCRAGAPADQDVLLSALLGVGAGDEWAQLTVLAGLADRLGWVVAGWARAGMPAAELADAEAELEAACWTAIVGCGQGPPPTRPGLALVDAAWAEVRSARRRQRRHDAQLCPLPESLPVATAGRPGLELLASAVVEAVIEDALPLRQARALYLTRVAGLSTADASELLGCGPAVVRVLRCRAAQRLAA